MAPSRISLPTIPAVNSTSKSPPSIARWSFGSAKPGILIIKAYRKLAELERPDYKEPKPIKEAIEAFKASKKDVDHGTKRNKRRPLHKFLEMILRNFFSFCVGRKWMSFNPAKEVKPPKLNAKQKEPVRRTK